MAALEGFYQDESAITQEGGRSHCKKHLHENLDVNFVEIHRFGRRLGAA
ncbi:hypothetical protein [Marivita sp.]|nr:hypothetical protein [Marivita sp.]